ncbi:MAG: hypothetical protein GC205_08870 [Bacteroidetes bacterium]|nr:hypothetical protein [Bacteroidota bacterium]
MKALTFAFLLFGTSFFSMAQTSSPMDSVGYAHNTIGTVKLNGETWVIETLEAGSLQRYVPSDQDKSWYAEGLEIVFSGVIGRPDPTVRSMGNPLLIKKWRKLHRASPDGLGP